MANADEALGQNVEQEPSDELVASFTFPVRNPLYDVPPTERMLIVSVGKV